MDGYLVLSRHVDEKIVCRVDGVEIELCVLEIRGDKVRLGLRAPAKVTIHRKEIQDRIDRGESP